jgi:hypothetical protein
MGDVPVLGDKQIRTGRAGPDLFLGKKEICGSVYKTELLRVSAWFVGVLRGVCVVLVTAVCAAMG